MSTNNLPDSLDELFPQLVNMSESEKILKLARHMPCDHCQQDCQGWRPDLAVEDFSLDACICGHDAEHHVDSKQDFVRRLKVALRIDELLEEKGKLDDYDYTDDDISSLKKQIVYNASTARAQSADFLSEASSPSSIDEDQRNTKRHRDSSDEEEEEDEDGTKRFKSEENESEDEKVKGTAQNDSDDEEEPSDASEEEEEESEDEDEEVEDEDEDMEEEDDEEDDDEEEETFEDAEEELQAAHHNHQDTNTNESKIEHDDDEVKSVNEPMAIDDDEHHDDPDQANVKDEDHQNQEDQEVEAHLVKEENHDAHSDNDDKMEEDHNTEAKSPPPSPPPPPPPKKRPLHDEDDDNDDEEDDEEEDEEEYETALANEAERVLLTREIPKIKSETEEGERLLNEEALKVNGVIDAKEGILDSFGNVKILAGFAPSDKKESPAMIEERTGIIEVRVVENDGSLDSMILLTGLKNIFQKQLPKMPKEYIARLVYDRNHKSMALIRKPMKVIGGICYRPFDPQEFAEIVFCAIASTEQVKGYGSFLMNHLKDYVSGHTNMKHYLTYADNYATGYFKKQGFTTEITLDKRKWVGYIKDYEGGTIMQCTTVPKVKYLQVHDLLSIQRKAVYEKMKEYSTSHIVYPGIQMPVNEEGKRCIDPYKAPGVRESGWTPEMDALSNRPRHPSHYNQMRHLVSELRAHAHSWPFHEAVNADEVTDYYDVITEPMDLTTLDSNVETDVYQTMEDFIRDVQKIFDNCRVYNAEATNYARCANRLERYFKERLRVWTNGDESSS